MGGVGLSLGKIWTLEEEEAFLTNRLKSMLNCLYYSRNHLKEVYRKILLSIEKKWKFLSDMTEIFYLERYLRF